MSNPATLTAKKMFLPILLPFVAFANLAPLHAQKTDTDGESQRVKAAAVLSGDGVKKNEKQAEKLLETCAATYPGCMHDLANFYETHKGNNKKATIWYEKDIAAKDPVFFEVSVESLAAIQAHHDGHISIVMDPDPAKNREKMIPILTKQVQDAEQNAADSKAAYEKYNADAQANPSNGAGLVAAIAGVGFANDYRSKTNLATKLRAQLTQLNAEQPAAITTASEGMTNALNQQHAMLAAQAAGPLGGGVVIPGSATATSAADTAGSQSSSGAMGGGMYKGPNAQLVELLLGTAGPYSCAPVKAPTFPKNFTCQRDGQVYKAQQLAWAAECSEQTGHHSDAVADANVMLQTLQAAKSLCNAQPSGLTVTCQTDRVLSCSQLPN